MIESRETLQAMETITTERYIAHEISADEYSAMMEDITVLRMQRGWR